MTRGKSRGRPDDPERRCIATGETQPAQGLVRFVVGPDGTLVPDIEGRLPGRGIWVSADRAAVERAVARRLFDRAARRQVTVAPDLADRVEGLLVRRLTDLVALARKSGAAVGGFGKVKDWLGDGTARVLLQAADGSVRERSRLRPPPGQDDAIDCLSARELGLAFGRERVIHAALGAGGLATRVVEEAARLAGFRAQGGDLAPGKEARDG